MAEATKLSNPHLTEINPSLLPYSLSSSNLKYLVRCFNLCGWVRWNIICEPPPSLLSLLTWQGTRWTPDRALGWNIVCGIGICTKTWIFDLWTQMPHFSGLACTQFTVPATSWREMNWRSITITWHIRYKLFITVLMISFLWFLFLDDFIDCLQLLEKLFLTREVFCFVAIAGLGLSGGLRI